MFMPTEKINSFRTALVYTNVACGLFYMCKLNVLIKFIL